MSTSAQTEPADSAQTAPTAAPAQTAPSSPSATQASGATAPESTEGAPAAEAAASSEPLAPVPATDNSCFPTCRTGYLCHQGQCISACNPACDQGESCNPQGECVRYAAPPPPPMYAPAYVPEGRPDPGAERHDGFFLRLAAGVGGGGAMLDTTFGESAYNGFGTFFSFDIGGSPVENLILHARISSFNLIEPEHEIDGEDRGAFEGLSIGSALVGAGVSYYIMPLNIYVGGTLGLAWISFAYDLDFDNDDRDDVFSSDVGLGLHLEVGKEWWVGDNWGLGVAMRLALTSAKPGELSLRDEAVNTAGLGVLFSATYQ